MIYIFYLEFSGLFYCSIIKLPSSVPACFLLTLFCVSEIYIITLFRSCQHFFQTFFNFFQNLFQCPPIQASEQSKKWIFPARSLLKHFAYDILPLLQKLFLCIFFCFYRVPPIIYRHTPPASPYTALFA